MKAPFIFFLVPLFASGCATGRLEQAHRFPDIWPGSQRLSEEAPTVSIQPLKMQVPVLADAASGADGLPSVAVLTMLLIKHLHATGVNAVLEEPGEPTAPFAMQCSVPQLGYAALEGFPEQYRYEAELACTLQDVNAQRMVWKRSLKQRYETTTVLNLMSKAPSPPHRHDRALYRECIVPLWDAMASSVQTALGKQPKPTSSAEIPATVN